jgi:DNA-directed RNA polymerase subunit RPC12/RpoP
MTKCSTCGKDLPDDMSFCGYCGKPVKSIQKPADKPPQTSVAPRRCVSCGRPISWDANACQYCGHDYRRR